jgi:hypothetical protein
MVLPSDEATRERDLIIKALVKMLGGSVTISTDELNLVDRAPLTIEVNQDFRYLILKVEEA